MKLETRTQGGLQAVFPELRLRSQPALWWHARETSTCGTYLPSLRLPVRPSVHPSNRMQRVRQGLAFFTRTHGAPFGYMLMPAAFRDTIQFSSLTSADLRYPVPERVKVHGVVPSSTMEAETARFVTS